MRRKYLPALSREDSLPSSHRSLRARRKPCGGGPAGVAKRFVEEEKVAAAAGEKVVRPRRWLERELDNGRSRRRRERERAEAIFWKF